MPILSSSVLSQLRDTNNNYTKTRVPFFPDDVWQYGQLLINNNVGTDGIFQDFRDTSHIMPTLTKQTDSYGSFALLHSQPTTGSDIFAACEEARLYGELDCRIWATFSLPQTTYQRFFFGFLDSDIDLSQDDLIDSIEGFGLCVQSGGNFKIISNDASSPSNISSDIDTIDTDLHTIYLESDSANSRFGYSLDNDNITYITSQIPSGNTLLLCWWGIVPLENASKEVKVYNLKGAQKWKK